MDSYAPAEDPLLDRMPAATLDASSVDAALAGRTPDEFTSRDGRGRGQNDDHRANHGSEHGAKDDGYRRGDRSRGHNSQPEFSLAALADLCTQLGRVVDRRELVPLLEEAARLLDAVGLIVWAWDRRANMLRASLAHGYAEAVLAQWPGVPLDAENGIASAFRSASPCVVDGGGGRTGAVVVPLIGPYECAGVLALELRHGGERREAVHAAATILAAQLVMLLGPAPVAEAVNS
jgi:hypothetical protein